MNDTVRVASLRANPNPIDPDVKVPAAVRRAAEAAEAAQRAAYPDQTPAPEPTSPPANSDTIQIAEPPATPPPTPTPPAPVTPTGNEPPPAPTPPVSGSAEDWAQKFRSAEGRRLKAEQQLGQAHDRIASLEEQMTSVMARLSAPPEAPQAPTRLITPEEENAFGPEMLDVMGRRAEERISPALAELRRMMQTIEQKVENVSTTNVQSARQSMLSSLDAQMPEWRQINVTDEFKAWLALRDPLFNVTRHSALTKAYEQNDTPRVLNFFKGFVSELAATTPVEDTTIEPAPAPRPAKPDLASLAAPGRARTSAQPNAPAEKQIITTADIDAFYAAVRRGAYNGREAEKASLEQELFAAQREGRVRAG